MSRYFENELIEQIKDANDIVSVVSEHVTLKKKVRIIGVVVHFTMRRRHPLVWLLTRGFIIVLAAMHREMPSSF